jgi:nicotinate-nucleotide pyrophosphorylase (carboxylating)
MKNIIRLALKEDIGKKDLTTEAIVPKNAYAKAVIIAKEDGVIAGLSMAEEAFMHLDRNIHFKRKVKDGDFVRKGKIIAEINGKARAILTAERTALNFLQKLSGIATLTRKFVRLAGKVKIRDTRKTTPLIRKSAKYAVKIGGGENHRMDLNEILIKENHIKAAGSVREAIKRARRKSAHIEVEVTNLDELKEALDEKAEVILLDNMDIKNIRKAIKLAKGKAKIEVSGGVNLANIKQIASAKPDYIAVGMLTHSSKALDMSLEIDEVK